MPSDSSVTQDRASQPDGRWGRAVVIGGGYAGLATARVLADFFAEVVILEQDAADEEVGVHPHVPQGYHAHAVMAKGAEVMERRCRAGRRTRPMDVLADRFRRPGAPPATTRDSRSSPRACPILT